MILDQFELKNMALRFENSAWTTECLDMYSFFLEHGRFMPRHYLFEGLTGVMLHLLLIICLADACLLTET